MDHLVKWYQYLLDLREGNVQHHNQGHYNVDSGVKHGQLKEKEAKHIEKQRTVVKFGVIRRSGDGNGQVTC